MKKREKRRTESLEKTCGIVLLLTRGFFSSFVFHHCCVPNLLRFILLRFTLLHSSSIDWTSCFPYSLECLLLLYLES